MSDTPRIVKAAAAAAAGALAAGACLLWLYRAGHLPLPEPDHARYPTRGIDVSHHQGPIDWKQVAGAGVDFAFIKASEGGDYRDRRFGENWRAAREAGLAVGAYHFFTFCQDGDAQAKNFLASIEEAEGPMLPPAIDLEFKGNCSRRPTAPDLHDQLLDFSDRVARALGAAPVFYVTPEFLRAYSDALPPGADIWIRSILFSPGREAGAPWTFWQFASHGRVPGIDGPVDQDVFNGSTAQWRDYLGRRGATAPADTASDGG